MVKRTMKAGWLVVAAALMIGLTACSNDGNLTEVPTATTAPQAVSTVHVTVGAGISDSDKSTTRVAVSEDVIEDKIQRTLHFSAGDKLFIYAEIAANTNYVLAGMVSIDASTISDDGKSAKFTGDLSVYDCSSSVTPSSWTFQNAAKPLAECSGGTANLIPKDAPDNQYDIISYIGYQHAYGKCIADDVATLMKSALHVSGALDARTQSFTLETVDAILNCKLGGLMPGDSYKVVLKKDRKEISYPSNYTADDDGQVSFAINLEHDSHYIGFILNGASRYAYSIGTKDLGTKVYNITRTDPVLVDNDYVRSDVLYHNQTGSYDDFLQTFLLDESAWGLQRSYALLKFKYRLCNSSGEEITLPPIGTITISVNSEHNYIVKDTRENESGETVGFDTNFQFYVCLYPTTWGKLTITYDTQTADGTYVATFDRVTYGDGRVYDLGTVSLVKTTD